MHERDLRRQALESGKTVSRKAKARHLSARSSQAGSAPGSAVNSPAASPRPSPAVSRAASRNPSRHGSDDEDDLSDDMQSSVASLDLNRFADFDNAPPEVWQHEVSECIEQIIERSRNKRNTTEAREETLAIYTNIVASQYAGEGVELRVDELVPALVKCFKSGSTLAATILSTEEEVYQEDTSSGNAQAMAIHALGAATFFAGADIQETEDVMDFFLQIILSDGEFVNAPDSGSVVTAALQEWGFLATRFEDLEGKSQEPMECFESQLDSNILSVQVAAGENIALLYEQSFTQLEEDEEPENNTSAENGYESGAFRRGNWAQRYNVYRDGEFSLKSKLLELSRSSARYLSKDKRKDLHKAFSDVSHSVDHPWRGPRFSTALNEDLTSYLGHRLNIKFGKDGSFVIDRWWKFHRYEAIKRILGGGFMVHYGLNERVFNALPSSLEAPAEF
ncbi:hypothetical protein EJ06DRAFT_522448 [Trichodelitschia bisporula]|uniref:Interferon-related developmental regulator N-terminal domain-containing protein n=1 Tax=Trichodelitschia bisporula TaxID=703511 RepID=A0A6G1HUR7_9PEZI|nr:hypothetical protein EJ06DRAFT_522448 [Trichodelitschia bisporula]